MRMGLIVAGVILLVAGIWVVMGNGSYESSNAVLEIGSVSLKATEEKAIPQWIGVAGIVVGALLAIGGFFTGGKRK